MFEGKTVLITGGTGSFGQAFIDNILMNDNPRKVIVLSRDELKQSEMAASFTDTRMRFLLGDIRDRERLYRAFQGVDIVVHAAALKQIPAGEYCPTEFVATNIIGAQNIINAAIDCNVEKVLALSTDKACHPVNLYGCTKATMERLMCAANAMSGPHKTRFACTRYGNVAGSRGSVIPVWRTAAKAGKPITVTDVGMTRFWMRLSQAVELVLYALGNMRGGEIYVPKLPSIKMTDLAEVMAPGKWGVGKIRDGEKLYESMVNSDEDNVTDVGMHYAINGTSGDKLGRFDFRSDVNIFLSQDEIRSELELV